MQEVVLKSSTRIEKTTSKQVHVSISSAFTVLTGMWDWDLNCNSIYCSDVMDFPPDFEGTKGIIHPEDLSNVIGKISEVGSPGFSLEFRIITSYGKVVNLKGYHLEAIKEESPEKPIAEKIYEQLLQEKETEKQIELFLIKDRATGLSERITDIGSWFINTNTNTVYYSDNFYRIFSLQPQSLNNHLNTFSEFIHPEDREIVEDIFEKAFKRMVPLHFKYRIIAADGKEKILTSISQWIVNEKGEKILVGFIQDYTEQKLAENVLEQLEEDLKFQRQVILADESFTKIGHWSINLVTLKVTYSEAYFRIFGVKPFSIPVTLYSFINFIHPDDRNEVTEALRKIRYEHSLPDFSYRIIRNDGKIKYIQQKGKLITYANELVMVGVIEDITTFKASEKKVKDITENSSLRNFSFRQAEEIANIGSWLWELNTDNIIFSDGLYLILGFRPQSVMLNQKRLMSFIYPADKKRFADELELILKQKNEIVFEFRILALGVIKFVRASFRILKNEEKEFFVATIQDITNEYRLQEKLRERVQLSESLSANINDGVIITDINNNILFLNEKIEESLKIKRDHALQNNYFDVFPFFKTEQVIESISGGLKGQKTFIPNLQFPSRKGYYNLSMVPLNDDEGKVNSILHVLHDITNEVQIQQSQTERLNFIEGIVDASVDRIIALDRNMNYVTWNRKCEEYYGYKKEEMLGRNVLEIFPQSVNGPGYDDFRKALRGETVYIPPPADTSGNLPYEEIYLIPVKNNTNEVTAVLWMLHDLSKEHELKKHQLRALEFMEAINENYFELDTDYRLIYINGRGEEFFQKKKDELKGKLIWDIFPHAVETNVHTAIVEAMENREGAKGEFVSAGKDVYIFASVIPTTDGVAVIFFDIKSIKENEHRLEQSEDQWKTLADNTPDAITRWDENFQLIFANKAFETITGNSLVNMIGKNSLELNLPKAYAEAWMKKIKEVFSDGREKEHVDYFHEKDGEVYLYAKMVPELDKEGNVVSVLSITRDITDLTRIQKVLTDANAQLLMKNEIYEFAEKIARLGTWTWNPDNDEVHYSDNMYKLFGLDRKETVTSLDDISEYIYHEDLDKVIQSTDILRRRFETCDIEYRVITRGGQLRTFRNKCKMHHTEKGEHIYIGTTQDITEEVSLRNKLTERILYAEAIIDASIDRILVTDKEYKLIGWNKKNEEITGLVKEEVLGQKLFEVIPEMADRSDFIIGFDRAFNDESIYLQVNREIDDNRFYETFFLPIKDIENHVYAVLCIMHDLTEIVLKNEELKELNSVLEYKNEELREKNDEITSFAFVASHDLKEPLRKIHTFSDILLSREGTGIKEEGLKYIKKIQSAVVRMDLLIEDIMAITKVHSDQKLDEVIKTDLILEKIKREFQKQIENTHAIIESGPLPVLKGNSVQLYYLLKNLISNSLKFQKPGNRPHIRISSQVLDGKKIGTEHHGFTYAVLSVADNGLGFDEALTQKLFGMFQRLHGKDVYEGTGMGLAICKKIMDNHGGFIRAHSQEGKGSVFSCYFPVELKL